MTDNKLINIICVVGPTASGKTALGVSLAELFNGEVVSADSMQLYREMSISTAKPTLEEMRSVKHHMIDFLEPYESYSVADYVKDANKAIAHICAKGKLPVLVGGTGLYVNSLLENVSFSEDSYDPEVRARLTAMAQDKGIDFMLSYLEAFDSEAARTLSAQRNLKRIIRAIEVYEITGKTFSQLNKESKNTPSVFNSVKIGPTCKDRQKLYDRINKRVDKMLSDGLLDEAFKIYNASLNTTSANATAVQAIGCKEMFPYFRGEKSLEECAEKLKQETRRYAKRQLTWFRRDAEINWIFTDEIENYEEIVHIAADIVKNRGFSEDLK